MPLNPDAVGTETEAREARWTSKDSLLYALGVGAGQTDPTGFELDAAPVPLPQLDVAIRDAAPLSAIDFSAAERVRVLVPVMIVLTCGVRKRGWTVANIGGSSPSRLIE